MKLFFRLLVLILITLSSSCVFFEYTSEARQIIIKSDSFTISWDSPEYKTDTLHSPITSYKIYYCPHHTNHWKLLGEADSISSKINITNDILGYGIYDIAVSSVDSFGFESRLHTSLDTTADPITGWYINWLGSN